MLIKYINIKISVITVAKATPIAGEFLKTNAPKIIERAIFKITPIPIALK